MATFAVREPNPAGTAGRASSALQQADLALLALSLPVFVLFGWPLIGYAALAAAWLAQHALLVFAQRRSTAASLDGDRRTALGIFAFATLGRVWLVTATVLAVGLIAERQDGLAAALLAAALVTTHLVTKVLARLLGRGEGAGGLT